MAGRKPDFKVFVSRNVAKKGEEPSNFYTEVGAAWNVDKGGISVDLHVLPLDGKIVLFPPRQEDS